MKVTVRQPPGAIIFDVVGDITVKDAPEFRKTVRAQTGGKPKRVVMNLAQVRYMDSSGVATLLDSLKHIRGYGGELRLLGITKMVRDLMEITRLDKVFVLCQTEEEALGNGPAPAPPGPAEAQQGV